MKFKINSSFFNLRFFLFGSILFLLLVVVKNCVFSENQKDLSKKIIYPVNEKFGYNFNNFNVVYDTVKNGDSFGKILEKNNLFYPRIHHISEETKKVFDIRQLRIGKPYMLLFSKDEVNKEPLAFIYEKNKIEYLVVEFCDSIKAYKESKFVKTIEKEAYGTIDNNLSETMEAQGLPIQLIYDMSDDIYAWTIDFFRLQKGDNFKVIYRERFVDDSIYAGIEAIDAAYFQHKGEEIYAFNYLTPDSKNSTDYYDDSGKSLQKAFLKSPIKFSRISSRYNLKRRIKLYGNRVRPHKGTDFAAAIGTPM